MRLRVATLTCGHRSFLPLQSPSSQRNSTVAHSPSLTSFTGALLVDFTGQGFCSGLPFRPPHWLARARPLRGRDASHTRGIRFYLGDCRRQNSHEETPEEPPENHHLTTSFHHHHITSARMQMHLARLRAQLASTRRPKQGLAAARVVRVPLPENSQKVCQ